MRLVISFCKPVMRSSIFSTLLVSSPVAPMASVTVPSSLIKRSRSFSCSFRTFTMKSKASSASSFDCGFLDMRIPVTCLCYMDVGCVDKRSESQKLIQATL